MAFTHAPLLRLSEKVDLGCPYCGLVHVPLGAKHWYYGTDRVLSESLGSKTPEWIRGYLTRQQATPSVVAAVERLPLKRVYLYALRHPDHMVGANQPTYFVHGFVVTTIDQGPAYISGERYPYSYGLLAVLPNTPDPTNLTVLNNLASYVATHEYTKPVRGRQPKKPKSVLVTGDLANVGAQDD